MANDKKFIVKNGLITQNIDYVSPDKTNTIEATMLDSDTLSFDGDSGQLFSITDSLTGTIFSVNDITGIPSIEVDDDGTIRFAEFAGNVLIGTDTDNGVDKLQVNGSISGDGSNLTKISVPTADAPPSSPSDGELWWDSDEGNMFIYYSDGSSNQWVTASVGYPGPQGPVGPIGPRGYTGSTTSTITASNDTSTVPLFPVMVSSTGSNLSPKINTSDLAFDSNNGRLGIGTASPNSTLDVNGDARFNGNIILPAGGTEITGGPVLIGAGSPSGGNGDLTVSGSITGNGSNITNVNANLLDGINSSQFLRSDTSDTLNGNLTINSGGETQLIIDGSGGSGNYLNLHIGESGAGSAAVHVQYRGDGRGWIGMGDTANGSDLMDNWVMQMQYQSQNATFNNNVTVQGTLSAATITETSTIKVKENLRPLENTLDIITKLNGYMFDRLDNKKKNQTGLIAEEVKEILPDLVIDNKDNDLEEIHYTGLIGYLIEGIKELKQEINNLKSKY